MKYLHLPIKVNVLGWLTSHAVVFAAGCLAVSYGWDIGLIVVLLAVAYGLGSALIRASKS